MTMNGRLTALVLLWLVLPLAGVAAERRVELGNGDPGPVSLGLSLDVLEDPKDRMTLEDVRGAAAADFRPLIATPQPNFGYTGSAYWLRALLVSRADREREWYLEVAFPTLDYLDMYLVDPGSGRLLQSAKTGDLLPFQARPFQHRNFVFPLRLPAGSAAVLYLRAKSAGSLTLPVFLRTPERFYQESRDGYLALGLYFGVLMALLVYNLLLYVSLRDRAYLWYVLFVLSMAVGQGAWNGLFYEFLWPGLPQWGNLAAIVGFTATGMFGALFSREFLDTPRAAPLLDSALYWLGVLFGLILVGTPFVPYLVSASFTSLVGIGFSLVAVTGGLVLMLRGFYPARFFLAAWALLLAGTAALGARNLGWLPTNLLTRHAMLIGSGLDMVLLSLALADRVTRLRQANTQLLQRQSDLHSLAHRDTLTGLGNRLMLEDRMKELMDETTGGVGLLMIDLDGFKQVNDSFGHDVGDELLRLVAERLNHSIRATDTAARLGGDEFVVVLSPIGNPDDVWRVGEKILRVLAQPFGLDGRTLHVSASVGAALFPADGATPQALLKRADQAMYRAKMGGRNRMCTAPGVAAKAHRTSP